MDISKNEIENLHFKNTPAAKLYAQNKDTQRTVPGTMHGINKKGIEYVSPSFDALEKKLADLKKKGKDVADEQHKGLIEFEHNQHKFLLNWLYSHSQGYKHAYPEGVPKAHEDHFTGKLYDDDDPEHNFKMEHNPDEKDVSGEDKHFGKTADEDDTHLKDTSEGEHKSGDDKHMEGAGHEQDDHMDHHKEGEAMDHETPENQDDPFKDDLDHGKDGADDHHDPTADGVEHNDKHHGHKSGTD